MKIFHRYILVIFCRFFLMILAALVALYALIDFLEKVDDFIEHGAGLIHYLLFPIYNLPLMLSNTLPMAVLLAAFATIGSLSRTSQLTALYGGGINLGQLSRPMFFCALLLSVAAFLSNAWVMPLANRQANYLMETELRGSSPVRVVSSDLFLRDGDRILNIASVFPAKEELTGISLLHFDDNFALVKRTDARHGRYVGDGRWRLQNAQTWTFSEEDPQILSYVQTEELVVDLGKRPEELVEQWQNPEDMTLAELLNRAQRRAAQGHDVRPLHIETQTRLARSATPLIMVLLGIPFALQRGRQASFALGFIGSLVIFMAYFVLEATFTAFAHAAILPVWVAAWAANLLLGLVGLWLFLKIHD